jgi:hypothetical protein
LLVRFIRTLYSAFIGRHAPPDAVTTPDECFGRPTAQEAQAMKLFEIEIGRRYKCDQKDGQYFATVKEKRDGRIGVVLGDKVGADSDPGEPLEGLIWLKPENIHPL